MGRFNAEHERESWLARRLAPLRRTVQQLALRGIVELLSDRDDVQFVKLQTHDDVTPDGVEHFQSFGFTSVPLKGAEGVVLQLGGNPDNQVVLCLFNRDKRPKDLNPGETALYDSEGVKVYLVPGGGLRLGSKTATKGAARSGDTVSLDATTKTWLAAAATALAGIGVTAPAPTGDGTIGPGSATVKVAD